MQALTSRKKCLVWDFEATTESGEELAAGAEFWTPGPAATAQVHSQIRSKNAPNQPFQGHPFARGPPQINREWLPPQNNRNYPGAGGRMKRKRTRILLASLDFLQRFFFGSSESIGFSKDIRTFSLKTLILVRAFLIFAFKKQLIR